MFVNFIMKRNKMRNLIILSILLLFSLSLNCKEVCGFIKDREGLPISAVIIEQNNTDIYTISDINGYFSIDLIPQKKIILRFKYIGYYTKEITINKEFNDTIYLTMMPGNDSDAAQYSTYHRSHVGGFGLYFGYKFSQSKFNNFTEFTTSQINQLNKNIHYIDFGLEGYIYNFLINLDFGVTPLQKATTDKFRHMTDSYIVSFNIGYGFNVAPKRSVIITPHIGVNHLAFREYVAPLDKKIPLSSYLEMGYMDINMLQYIGTIGCDFTFKLCSTKANHRQGLYLSLGADYQYKMNSTPYISSTSTKITTNSKINIFPLIANISLNYYFFTKQKSWKKY